MATAVPGTEVWLSPGTALSARVPVIFTEDKQTEPREKYNVLLILIKQEYSKHPKAFNSTKIKDFHKSNCLPTWNNALQASRLQSEKPASRKAVWEARGPPRGRSSISNPTWGWKLKQSSQTPKKKGVWGALGTRELPKGLRFQDLAVKRKFNLNLIEGQTQGHPALANQNKSFLSNCVYKQWAQAMRRRSSTRQASASSLWSRETAKEQKFNSYPEVTR